jgi:16S rRNA (guanine527-N7)-methyltransferase
VPRTDSGTDPGPNPGAAGSTPVLRQILDEARAAGFLGPGPLDIQLRHSEGFVVVSRRLWPDGTTPPVLLDLGSGGGLPGLVVAVRWPEVSLLLLDSHGRRTAFLNDAVRRLGLEHRVSVRQDRAEVAGRDPGLRGSFDGVLARSFGRPAVVAECAAPLLRPGGWLIVSEPPATSPADPPGDPRGPAAHDPVRGTIHDALPDIARGGAYEVPGEPRQLARWPAEPLRQLGLVPERLIHEEFEYQTLRQTKACPDRFPRRDGVPAKRPLF